MGLHAKIVAREKDSAMAAVKPPIIQQAIRNDFRGNIRTRNKSRAIFVVARRNR